MSSRAVTASTVFAFVLAACGGGPLSPASEPAAASSAPAPVVPVRSGLAAVVEAALVHAASKTGLGRSELKVKSSEAVVWADGSLGCAQPGMNYTMAPVPGYRIMVDAGGELLDYHASEWGQLILCPTGHSVSPSPAGTT